MSPTLLYLIIMGFQSNAQRSSNNNANGQNESWKAQGFLNLYLPSKDGKRLKLGAIGLKNSRNNDRQLLEALEKGDSVEEILASMKDKLIIEYRSAEASEGSGFDL